MGLRVIPVIDLLGGQVVRGIAGRRAEYRPVASQIAGDAQPATVAAAFASQFRFTTAYVADLDAITRNQADVDSWSRIADAGLKLILDAGVGSLAAADGVLAKAAQRKIAVQLVVGLETLQSLAELAAIARLHEPVIFSLDLKVGQALSRGPEFQGLSPLAIVDRVLLAGATNLIVLDLADVGTSSGTRTLDLCRAIHRRDEMRQLIAGGGVRGPDDLAALADAGCDAALVASALHDRRLTPQMLAAFAENHAAIRE